MNIGLCLPDPHPETANDGSYRTLAAVRFAGRYRLVDFVLSNMVNSDIFTVAMIINNEYQNLIKHVGTGREWDLSRKNGGISFFTPYLSDDKPYSGETDGSLERALNFINISRAEYVIVSDSSTIYSFDYRFALDTLRRTATDITAVYTVKPVPPQGQRSVIVFELDGNNRVLDIKKAAATGNNENVSLNTFIMRKSTLMQLLASEKSCMMDRFSCEILAKLLPSLKVSAHEYSGYSAQIYSQETFFQYNMDMLDSEKRASLFNNDGKRIYTSVRDSPPTEYGIQSEVKNSIVADGCRIEGTVENSIIFRNVSIKPGAVVRNSILQEGTIVDKNSALDWIITDRSVIITENRNLMGYETYPVYIPLERIV